MPLFFVGFLIVSALLIFGVAFPWMRRNGFLTADGRSIKQSTPIGQLPMGTSERLLFDDRVPLLVHAHDGAMLQPRASTTHRDVFCRVTNQRLLFCQPDAAGQPALWWVFNHHPAAHSSTLEAAHSVITGGYTQTDISPADIHGSTSNDGPTLRLEFTQLIGPGTGDEPRVPSRFILSLAGAAEQWFDAFGCAPH